VERADIQAEPVNGGVVEHGNQVGHDIMVGPLDQQALGVGAPELVRMRQRRRQWFRGGLMKWRHRVRCPAGVDDPVNPPMLLIADL
jgi:hypothetical protein